MYEVTLLLYEIVPAVRFCKKEIGAVSFHHENRLFHTFVRTKSCTSEKRCIPLSYTQAKKMAKHLIISTATELVRIVPQHIVYFSSDGNYTTMMQIDGETRVLTSLLGNIEKRIEKQLGNEGKAFVRLGKSLIINSSYIYYINPAKQKLKLSDAATFCHELPASKEALKQLKEYIEKEAE